MMPRPRMRARRRSAPSRASIAALLLFVTLGACQRGTQAPPPRPWRVAVVQLDDEHEMISWGFANTTPWHTYREQDEQQLAAAYAGLADQLERPERAVFNLHPPPYATQLDDAPALDDDLRVQAVLGQVQYQAVGSTAVRDIEAERQPLVGLHGHIHESSGIRRLGKRRGVILNPGSDYSTGALNGALVSLQKDRATAQLVRG